MATARYGADNPPSATLPSGTVAFLFTDVEGSTMLWEQHGEAMAAALDAHDRCIRDAVARHNGYVFTTAGDSFAVAFAGPHDALATALDAQLQLLEPMNGIELRVRMGIHIGSATMRDGDYFGPALNRTARLMAAGHGGQILVSGAFRDALAGEADGGIELADLGEHQLKDLSRPEHIYQVRRAGLKEQFPPLRSIRTKTTNLPTQLTTFVGRDEELREAARLLGDARLLTLTGTGGSGKTRLAVQLGADSIDDFPGGVRMVELASLVDPERIPDEVANVFGIDLEPGVSIATTLAPQIKDQPLLLILDNCENLIDAAAELAEDLLLACPKLKILATSIELLKIEGEVAYRLPPMDLPEATEDVENVRTRDSVRLFTERAVQAKPDFQVTADNASDVVAITRHLDGMPLALELAAARLRTLSVSQLAARLDERFGLLSAGRRSRVARHQTLEAAIDWSHELLSPQEQMLFRRLSVFAGNFTLEALADVCCTDGLEADDAVELISELVDKSMVAPENGPLGENRYRLLETLRRYGSIKLEEAGEGEQFPPAHLDYFMELTDELLESLDDDPGAILATLNADQDNVRSALAYGLASDRLRHVARIIGSVWFLWYQAGRSREAVDWSGELFRRELDLPDDLMAKALHAHGTLLGIWEEPEAGIPILEQEVALRERVDDPAALSSALNNLGNLLRDAGQAEDAEASFRRAIEVKQSAGLSVFMEQINLGEVYLNVEDYDRAAALYDEALAGARAASDAYGTALATFDLGQCDVRRGSFESGRPLLEESRAAFEAMGVRPGVAEAEFFLALADRAEGHQRSATERLLASLQASDAHWTSTLTLWNLQAAAAVVGPRHGAEILGAVKEHRHADPGHRTAYFARDHDTVHEKLQAALGDEQFAAKIASGRRLTLAEAIARAENALRGEL